MGLDKITPQPTHTTKGQTRNRLHPHEKVKEKVNGINYKLRPYETIGEVWQRGQFSQPDHINTLAY